MSELFDRDIYFSNIRSSLFNGTLDQDQVDGQEAILTGWESYMPTNDMRWLAYMLATTKHETASTMQPVEEYGKGEGMEYGIKDETTGQVYFGRGFVQLTWGENYAKATVELGLTNDDDLLWHADRALDPLIAARTMALGMIEGWFRSDESGRQTLGRYFNSEVDDPYGAREIINGDKHIVPDWSQGLSIGNLIADYHDKFLLALKASWTDHEDGLEEMRVEIDMILPPGIRVNVSVNGELVTTGVSDIPE